MHWKMRSRLMTWFLGTLTVAFLLYQWLPVFTLGLLSFSGPAGGTTFPMNGVSLHWYRELLVASIMNDFKPPFRRSVQLAALCSVVACVLSVMSAKAMRGSFRGHKLFFDLLLLAIFNRFGSRLEEAALTLGANRLSTFRRITLPIVMPGVIGAALFGFTLSCDEFPRTMFTSGADMTLPLAVMWQLDREPTPELYAIGTATTLILVSLRRTARPGS